MENNAHLLGGVVRVVVEKRLCVSVIKLGVIFVWVMTVRSVAQRLRECFPGGRWTICNCSEPKKSSFMYLHRAPSVPQLMMKVDDRNI